MRHLPQLFLITSIVLALPIRADDTKKTAVSDSEKIEGVWRLTDQWVNGDRTDVSQGRIAFRFRKNLNEYGRVRDGGFQPIGRPSTFTLDTSKTPKQMDVIAPEAAEEEGSPTTKKTSAASRTTFVTYTLDGDTLILCRMMKSCLSEGRTSRPQTG